MQVKHLILTSKSNHCHTFLRNYDNNNNIWLLVSPLAVYSSSNETLNALA